MTIKRTIHILILTWAVLAVSLAYPTNAKEINLGEFYRAAGFGNDRINLKTLLLYGTAQLRTQQNELQ